MFTVYSSDTYNGVLKWHMSIWLHLEKESDSGEDSKHLLRLKENRHIAQWLCMCGVGVGVSLFF